VRAVRRSGRIALVVGLLAGFVALDSSGKAQTSGTAGATLTDLGWWSRTPSTTTPEGGFQIARDASGERSVAAVRLTVEGTLSQALLIVSETTGGFLQESAVIDVCPTTAPWTAVVAGPLEEAPAADCERKLQLERNSTTGQWTVDLLPLIDAGATTVAVVLKPAPVAAVAPPTPPSIPSPVPVPLPVPPAPAAPVDPVPTPVDPGFTIDFSRAEVFASGSSAASEGPSASTSSATGTIASGATTFAPTFSVTESFAASSAPSVTPTPDVLPAATPTVGVSGAGGVGTAASVESGLQPVAAATGPGAPWGRLLVLIPLSALIGALGAGARRLVLDRSFGVATGG
jgi:hypothetical protein